MNWDETKGFTVTCFRWEDAKEWVEGRFDTKEEMKNFLDDIHKPDSGWLDEELQTIRIINDKHYLLCS